MPTRKHSKHKSVHLKANQTICSSEQKFNFTKQKPIKPTFHPSMCLISTNFPPSPALWLDSLKCAWSVSARPCTSLKAHFHTKPPAHGPLLLSSSLMKHAYFTLVRGDAIKCIHNRISLRAAEYTLNENSWQSIVIVMDARSALPTIR